MARQHASWLPVSVQIGNQHSRMALESTVFVDFRQWDAVPKSETSDQDGSEGFPLITI